MTPNERKALKDAAEKATPGICEVPVECQRRDWEEMYRKAEEGGARLGGCLHFYKTHAEAQAAQRRVERLKFVDWTCIRDEESTK